MPVPRLRRSRKNQWTHAGRSSESPLERIRAALTPQTDALKEQLGGLLTTRRRLSDAIVLSGEILAESAQTPFGRVIVAACSLTGAWLLL
jgi:hypothetical protein